MQSLSFVTNTREKIQTEESDCSNYRGITLLSIAGKILAHVILKKFIPTIAQENMTESQWVQVQQRDPSCDLHAEATTGEMQNVWSDFTSALHQSDTNIEKCREQNTGLYAAFVDLTKALKSVSHD